MDLELFKNKRGAIPVPRVESILANTRAKTEQRTEARLRTEFANDLGVDPAVYKQLGLREHLQAFTKNPVQYWHDLGATLQRAGVKLPALPGAAAPAAPAAGAAAPPAAAGRPAASAAMPQIPAGDIIAELADGTKTETYSANAMRQILGQVLTWQAQQIEAKFTTTLSPLQKAHEEASRNAELREAWDQAAKEFEEIRKWPHFEDIRKDVAELMKRDGRYSVEGAYRRIFNEKIYPQLQGSSAEREAALRKQWTEELNRAPVASTVSPSGATPRAAAPAGGRRSGVDWDTAINAAIDKHAPAQ